MSIIINLLITAISAFLLQKILPGISIEDFGTSIILALVLGILNLIVKPVLSFLGLPLTIITFGLFSLVINAVIFLIADYFIDGMHIDGFWYALLFSIALSVVTSILSSIFTSND